MQVMEEEMASVMEQQQHVRRATQDVLSSRRLDEQQQQLQQQRLADAEARLKKARLLAQGPVLPKVSFALLPGCKTYRTVWFFPQN